MDRTDIPLIPTDTPWLNDPAAQRVCSTIIAGGHTIYFVGGCVRNAVLGQPNDDVDLATDALPEQVIALSEQAGLKAVPTGIDHGTVTVVAGGEGYEVTTFRRDVQTDGRRAVIAFSTDIEEDARRRDFTMNALYADLDGQIVDPLGGLADTLARQVRFIEDAGTRIREDYLRILRFFRFHAWYGQSEDGFDHDAIAAISSNLGGLETLSAERIGAEIKKLLSAPTPEQSIAGMRQTGVLSVVLPGSDDRWLGRVVHLEEQLGLTPDWVLRLAVIGGIDMQSGLRMSRSDARRLDLLREVGFSAADLSETAYRHGRTIALQAAAIRAAIASSPCEEKVLKSIEKGAAAAFPISASDLMPTYEGARLGARIAQLEKAWIASNFELTAKELLLLPDN